MRGGTSDGLLNGKVFDVDALAGRMMGDRGLMALVLKGFLENIPSQFEILKQNGERRDYAAIGSHLHTLKGSAATIAAPRLHAITLEMETCYRNRQLDRCLELLPPRRRPVRRFSRCLKGEWMGVTTLDGPTAFAAAMERFNDTQRPLKMLLVEDDFGSRLLLHTFLSRWGECHIAVNGREAVDAFRTAAESGQQYDVICMDIVMPEMNGREAVRQIRAIEERKGVLPNRGARILMVSCVDDISEVGRCFGELCDAYITKPVDLSMLKAQLSALLSLIDLRSADSRRMPP